MPNKTLEIRELYLQQSPLYLQNQINTYSADNIINWPGDGYFNQFEPDSRLLQDSLKPQTEENTNIADKIFGDQKKRHHLNLRHSGNLFYERCKLHNSHIKEIDNTITNPSSTVMGVKGCF